LPSPLHGARELDHVACRDRFEPAASLRKLDEPEGTAAVKAVEEEIAAVVVAFEERFAQPRTLGSTLSAGVVNSARSLKATQSVPFPLLVHRLPSGFTIPTIVFGGAFAKAETVALF
jgi:hypothetical protein